MADPILMRQVRLLIPDTDAIYGSAGNEYMFSDQDIEDFLSLGQDNVKWAAGLAKITVGGSEALILKVIRNYETSTDGATLMRQWTLAGESMVAEAKAEIASVDDVLGHFEVAEFPSIATRNSIEAVPDYYGW